MRVHTESIFEKDGKKYIPTYHDGKLWANWEISGNAPDDYSGVGVPDGYSLVSGSVSVYDPQDGGGEMISWDAISDDRSSLMRCKNHFE